ncbi:MAG: hypothetical protein F4Y97_00345 [Dehalococcoidia bacterium]|nr:hypothetical protein [Dehalococcoidia bacterium]
MPATDADRTRIEAQIALIPRLRGTGPNPFEYDQWDARTVEVLTAAFGAESDEVARYQRDVGEAGRVAGVRGNAANMTLNIHGKWGILERLERAESLLRELAGG